MPRGLRGVKRVTREDIEKSITHDGEKPLTDRPGPRENMELGLNQLSGFNNWFYIRMGFVPSDTDAFYELHKEAWEAATKEMQQKLDAKQRECEKLQFLLDNRHKGKG